MARRGGLFSSTGNPTKNSYGRFGMPVPGSAVRYMERSGPVTRDVVQRVTRALDAASDATGAFRTPIGLGQRSDVPKRG